MHYSTEDMIKAKLLDAQENVRDFQSYAREVKDEKVRDSFKKYAEENAVHASEMLCMLDKYTSK